MSEYNTKEVPNRSTNSNNNCNGRDVDDNKFLKVTPNLFTAERLHLFDSLDLYASLIKSSKSIEHGERLHNLSWRIINKALLKDKNLNKSKKKDGVKNMYYVLNPLVKNQQPKQPTIVNAAPPLRSDGPMKQSGDAPNKMKSLGKASKTIIAPIAEKNSSHTPKTKQHKSTSCLYQANRTSQNLKNKKEDPQTVVKGFDPNTIITANKNSSKHVLRTAKSNVEELKQKEKNTFYIGASPSPEPNASATTTSGNNSHKILSSRQESLFGKPKAIENHATVSSNNHSNIFFSSEDEDDSDWDADSMLYDEEDDEDEDKYGDDDDEEEDQYYRNQWDKLLSKNQSHHVSTTNSSGNITPTSTASHDQIKRSLLSGLFLNEQINGNNKSKTTSPIVESPNGSTPSSVSTSMTVPASMPTSNIVSHTHSRNINSNQRATLGTSTITAVGSVTPPQRNTGAFSGVLNKQTSISSRGSFSSIVSESTRERFNNESNAPPAAQNILPTALSTHMFLPNNIHQQRMAAAAAAGSGTEAGTHSPVIELRKKPSRRESMDIPSKNRKNTFLKTRMEISEEEKLVRAYPRRNL